MHEVGVITQILKTIEGIMEKENLSYVDTIVLDVGELSGVVPHFMEECFPAATYHTPFEKTKLQMNVIPGLVKCDMCGEEFRAYECDLKCPKCGEDRKHTPLTGRELLIKEIRGN